MLDQAGSPSIIGNVIEENGFDPASSVSQDTEGAGTFIDRTDTVLIQNNIIKNNIANVDAAIGGLIGDMAQHLVLVQNLIYGNSNTAQQVVILGSNGQTQATLIETNNTIIGGGEEILLNLRSSTIANNISYNPAPPNSLGVGGLLCTMLPNGSPPNTENNDIFIAGSISVQYPCSLRSGNLQVAPGFVNFQTFDFHEAASSATIGSGLVTAPALPSADLNGKARTVCGAVDMGAYELHPQPPIFVTSMQNPSVGGAAVTFTANLTGNCNIPMGTVTYYDGATPLGTQTLSAGAFASLATTALTVGSHNITVGYPGDFNFDASTSATLVQVVTGYPTTTTLAVLPNPANAFAPIALSSTVTSIVGVPNGTVTFTAGGAVLATATLNANGQATATISSLGAGATPSSQSIPRRPTMLRAVRRP